MDIRVDFLESGYFYHIYNRGINSCVIFKDDNDKYFFLKRLKEYLLDYVDFYAYCLMSNHYHLILRIKNNITLTPLKPKMGLHSQQSIVSKQIGKLMSSYTQAFNKKYHRHGALLEKPFKRKRIISEEYLRQAIVYVHRNSLDINNKMEDYLFSSYPTILSTAITDIKRREVIALFEDVENFVFCHQKESLYRWNY
ncbi:transposase [Capnocytophaga canis]|uniref:hypothetical protein n=1 Tax=Capnocytophaga TaxID=1016 RepID=UPI000BB1BF1C|nr:hypothetical protein [Capnocytophaga sp. H4358]ATA72912.1 hypothetical protein CGC49_06260 [Capnocytophaga sp. H4358]